MARSIDRLIRLARKTGDRLIIHDPSDERDIVIMDLDQYEMLVDAKSDLEEYIEDFQQYRETFSSAHEVVKPSQSYGPASHHIPVDIPIHDEPISSVENEEVPFPQEETFVAPKEHESASQEESVFDVPAVSPALKQSGSLAEEDEEEVDPPMVSLSRVANWTPASSLLEEKFRALTGQGTPAPTATPDQEPRRVPMKEMHGSEEEFDEDDDEPVFLEEPV